MSAEESVNRDFEWRVANKAKIGKVRQRMCVYACFIFCVVESVIEIVECYLRLPNEGGHGDR